MKSYSYYFKIGEVCIQILSDISAEIEEAFSVFQISEQEAAEPDYVVEVCLVSALHIPEGECVYHGSGISILKIEEDICVRVLQEIYGDKKEYAVSFFDWKCRKITAEILENKSNHADCMREIFKCVAWEVIMLQEQCLILHASYLKTPYGGIAFSGPSGIGKTTQAELWCSYREAEMLNGDKAILRKKGESWIGYGSPYAGSSQCYVNKHCELKYLFFLKQGKSCSLRKMPLTEAFKEIYAGITLNRWDVQYVQMACELVEKLAIDVPVYEFTCTPDEYAVEFLQKSLEGGEICGFNK